VHVAGDADTIRLRVSDDGEPVHGPRNAGGYGIVGMVERADLLGGSCTAGPDATRGWVVSAEIPRHGAPA
jgi:signal transduction histidine kinase